MNIISLIKEIIYTNKIKNFWNREVDHIFYLLKRVENFIPAEEILRIENISTIEQIDNIDKVIVEVNEICKINLVDLGFIKDQDWLYFTVFLNKKKEIFLHINIVNESWIENSHCFKINGYLNLNIKKDTIYENGFYKGLNKLPDYIKYPVQQIKVIFPLSKKNKKIMVRNLVKESMGYN